MASPSPRGARDFLRDAVRQPAADPDNPWALAHGVLAFGAEHTATDGVPAVETIFSFAGRDPDSGLVRFEAFAGGHPVEPHPHMMARALLDAGVPAGRSYRGGDGSTVTLLDLLATANADAQLPQGAPAWHAAAWWMDVRALRQLRAGVPLPPPTAAAPGGTLVAATLRQLDEDLRIFERAVPAAEAFAGGEPMGLAKRQRSHIYGHACGGWHFIQAAMRLVLAEGDADAYRRVLGHLRGILTRARAEAALYRGLLADHPRAALRLTAQQLKFFGHLLELVAWLPVDRLHAGAAERTTAAALRKLALAELVAAVARLRALDAYRDLEQVAWSSPQLALDLVGDGCHALAGLERSLRD